MEDLRAAASGAGTGDGRAGPRGTAGPRGRVTAGRGSRPGPAAGSEQRSGPADARQALVGLDVLGPGGLHHVLGQRRRRLLALAVPAGLRRGQPVADVLLVEGRLRVTRLP